MLMSVGVLIVMTIASILVTVVLFKLHGRAMALGQRLLRRLMPSSGPVPFCPAVEALPKFQRIPVPFFASVDKNGRPDFKAINPIRRVRCANERLCFICGTALGKEFVFLGGPKSAKSRWYIDGPMHEACCRDALRVCPFLLGRMDYRESPEGVHKFAHVDPQAPDDLVMVTTWWFTTHQPSDGSDWLFRAAAPLIRQEVIPRKHPQTQEA